MFKLPQSLIDVIKVNPTEEVEIVKLNEFDDFDNLINNGLVTINNAEIVSLCRTIYTGIVRTGFESSLSSSMILLFSTIDEYSTLIKDKSQVDKMENDHYSALLAGINAELEMIDILAAGYKAQYDSLKSEGKTVEAFQVALVIKDKMSERAKLMKQQYKYMVAITTDTYMVKGDDLVVKKRKDLIMLRTNILKMLNEFNLTPKTIQVTNKGVSASPLAELLSKGMNNENKVK